MRRPAPFKSEGIDLNIFRMGDLAINYLIPGKSGDTGAETNLRRINENSDVGFCAGFDCRSSGGFRLQF